MLCTRYIRVIVIAPPNKPSNRPTSRDDDPRTIRVTARVAYRSRSPFDAVGQPGNTRRGPSRNDGSGGGGGGGGVIATKWACGRPATIYAMR